MIESEIREKLKKADQLFHAGENGAAAAQAAAVLHYHPDNVEALFAFAIITRAAENFGVSMLASRRLYDLAPNNAAAVNCLGHAFYDSGDEDSAEALYKRAMELKPHAIWAQNLANLYANRCQPEIALEWFAKCRTLPGADGLGNNIAENEAHALLALRRWEQGWKQYTLPIGKSRHRPDKVYGDAKLWNEEKAAEGPLVIHGEQGLGDELMFASCIPDVRDRYAGGVIIDVQPRLKGLMARSFPWAEVYGTRTEEAPAWLSRKDAPIYKTAISRLPMFYRNRDEDFPGTPYLIADPLRRRMYRALLDGIRPRNPRRCKVGLAWTGGMVNTGLERRSLTMEQLKPLLDAFPDVDFVSLQYKEAPEAEAAGVHHFAFATQSKDYDDTAALVAELDAVVTVQTSLVHLCGGLGRQAFCLVSNRPIWRYGREGSRMLWYDSVKICRQPADGPWLPAIDECIGHLKEYLDSGAYYRRLPQTAE